MHTRTAAVLKKGIVSMAGLLLLASYLELHVVNGGSLVHVSFEKILRAKMHHLIFPSARMPPARSAQMPSPRENQRFDRDVIVVQDTTRAWNQTDSE